MSSEGYMRLALRLARRGLGKTSPNPMVGAIIVRHGRIIGQGYHRYFGGPHAEIDALSNATESVSGATMYVTLEPCCHQGKKTPPCTDALISSGISRVVIGSLDPNPQVNGKGLECLRRHGIETEVGVLQEECRALNESHLKLMATGLPLVTVKYAASLDGRIATATGNSKWLSSVASRRLAHRLRALHDAVMVGAGTVLADDPQLNVRLVKGKNPLRVVVDSRLRSSLDSKLLTDGGPTLIATTGSADKEKLAAIRKRGIEVVLTEERAGQVDLRELLAGLGRRSISSVLVEGGSKIITSLLRLGLVDRLVAIVSPKILGNGIEAVGELDIKEVSQAIPMSFRRIYRSGDDLVIETAVLKP